MQKLIEAGTARTRRGLVHESGGRVSDLPRTYPVANPVGVAMINNHSVGDYALRPFGLSQSVVVSGKARCRYRKEI